MFHIFEFGFYTGIVNLVSYLSNDATNNLSTETSNFDESQTKFIAAYKNLEAAKKEAETEIVKLRDQLRKDVSLLAVHGAQEILKKEVDQAKHNDILKRLEAEL